jgi:hypothetical protein
VIAVAGGLTLACSGDDAESSANGGGKPPPGGVPGGCYTGEFEPCKCESGITSVRECLANGARGACQCDPWGPDAGDWKGGKQPQTGVTIVKLPAFAVRPDPTNDGFYLTIGNPAPQYQDSLVALAPDGSVSWSMELGAAPNALAVSSDGGTAHVGVRQPPGIARVDLGARAETGRSAIPPYGSQPSYVYDIEAVPGQPNRALVVYSTSPLSSNIGTALLLENGVQVGTATGSFISADQIAVRDAATAYACDATSTGGTLYTLALSAAGVSVAQATNDALDDFPRHFVFDGEWLFTSEGQAVDPVAHAVVGAYPMRGPIVSDRAADRVYVTSVDDTAAVEIVAFDRDGFDEVGRLTIEDLRGSVLGITQSLGGTLALLVDSRADRLEADNWVVLVSPTVLPGN